MLSPIFEQKWGIPPAATQYRWTICRGKPALFSEIRREGSLGAQDLPKIVFLGAIWRGLVDPAATAAEQ